MEFDNRRHNEREGVMYNKVTLIGNLVADPEIKYTPAGTPIGKIRLACTEKYKPKGSDQTKEETLFITCELWDKQASNAQEYLKKGSKVFIEGKLRIKEYENDGIKKWFTSVRVSQIKYLSPQKKMSDAPENPDDNFSEFNENEVPFS